MSLGFDPRGHAVSTPLASFSPVLSLTVLDARTMPRGVLDADSRVLIVVRRPATNPTHPNVVSVPTQRLPRSLFREIVTDADEPSGDPEGWVYSANDVDSDVSNGRNPVIYATEALLARKLGAADLVERSELRFRAQLRARVAGQAIYDELGPYGASEPIDMLNIVVRLTEGRDTLPSASASYSHMLWTPVSRLLEALARRDPTLIDPVLDPLELCLHGLCLSAAQTSIRSLLGDGALGRPAPLAASGNG